MEIEPANTYSTHILSNIRDTLEKMSKINQTQVLSLLVNDIPSNMINDNKNGFFINLTDLKNETIEKLINYIKFVNSQDIFLQDNEQQKEEYFNQYYSENKEKTEKMKLT